MAAEELLRAYRLRHGWSQSEASAATGVPPRTWQGWEAGRPLPKARLLTRLLEEALATTKLDPPTSEDETQRDEELQAKMPVLLGAIIDSGTAVGWEEHEVATALLSGVVNVLVAHSGAPAAREMMKLVSDALKRRIEC